MSTKQGNNLFKIPRAPRFGNCRAQPMPPAFNLLLFLPHIWHPEVK